MATCPECGDGTPGFVEGVVWELIPLTRPKRSKYGVPASFRPVKGRRPCFTCSNSAIQAASDKVKS